MPEETIVRFCSPTLAGIKTASLFSHAYESPVCLLQELRALNRLLARKGLCALPLRYAGGKALIYLFRRSRLQCDLSDPAARALLEERGYSCESPEKCIAQLIGRLKEYEEFPHEIGLFLGYPLEDVRGFIENSGCNCKCVGCWKVYSDEKACQKLFEQYRLCTEIYLRNLSEGKSIDQLTVAV